MDEKRFKKTCIKEKKKREVTHQPFGVVGSCDSLQSLPRAAAQSAFSSTKSFQQSY